MTLTNYRGGYLLMCLFVSSLCYAGARFAVMPLDWLAYGLLYVILLFLGVYVAVMIDTSFDDKIEAQELKTLQYKRLSDITDHATRQHVAQRIDKKTRWVKAWVSLFIGIGGGLLITEYMSWLIPGMRLALSTGGLSAFGPVIFLNLLRAVIRFDYRGLLGMLARGIADRIDPGRKRRDEDS